LDGFAVTHVDVAPALAAWAQIVRGSTWRTIVDVRKTYRHADPVKVGDKVVTIFNVKGNHYRLVVAIDYPLQVVNVLKFMTHAEYSKNRWKDSL